MPNFLNTVKSKRFKDPSNDNVHVCIQSFNKESTIIDLRENTKYLIVGTLTPCKGRDPNDFNKGYFYCGRCRCRFVFLLFHSKVWLF